MQEQHDLFELWKPKAHPLELLDPEDTCADTETKALFGLALVEEVLRRMGDCMDWHALVLDALNHSNSCLDAPDTVQDGAQMATCFGEDGDEAFLPVPRRIELRA